MSRLFECQGNYYVCQDRSRCPFKSCASCHEFARAEVRALNGFKMTPLVDFSYLLKRAIKQQNKRLRAWRVRNKK